MRALTRAVTRQRVRARLSRWQAGQVAPATLAALASACQLVIRTRGLAARASVCAADVPARVTIRTLARASRVYSRAVRVPRPLASP